MNEETTLEGVKWRFGEGEHEDSDVRWLLAEVDRFRAQNEEWRATATHALDVIDDLKRKVSSVEALASKLERRGAYVTGWQGQAAKEIRAALRGNSD